MLYEKYGEKEADKRIFVTTDKEKELKDAFNEKGYPTLSYQMILAEDIVFISCWFVADGAANINIDEVLEGAKKLS